MDTDRQVGRLNVAAQVDTIAPTSQYIAALACERGVPRDRLPHVEMVVEQACTYLVENSFDPGDDGEYSVSVSCRPNQIAIVVADQGMPNDFTAPGPDATRSESLSLMRRFADLVSFQCQGREGNRIELLYNLPPKADSTTTEEAEPPRATDQVSLRLMVAEDAISLSRCVYRSYGYTYATDFVYYPEQIVAKLDNGQLVSCVAINEAQEVVGHLAMQLDSAQAMTGETGIAVVDPRYRGRKLFELMKDYVVGEARRRGMFGLYSEAVAVHVFTQKGNLSLGARETGCLLGFTPENMVFRKIREDQSNGRQTAILFYLPIKDAPPATIYAPPRHRDIMDAIYAHNGVERSIFPAPAYATLHDLSDQPTRLVSEAKARSARAFITIHGYGADVLTAVHGELTHLCAHGMACIYLDLPLSDPFSAVMCKAFEAMGFFFAGLLVEPATGDSLRLQYLHGVTIDPAGINVASPFARQLVDYVLAARQRVTAPITARPRLMPQ